MAQTGFTPIQLYSTSTAAAAPSASNLTNSTLGSELAINITDGKLFYKDNANAVQVIGWKTVPTTAGGTGLTTYTAGDLSYYATGTTFTKLAIGTIGQILTSTGSAPQWTTLSGVAVTTFSAGTTGFTPNSATSGAVTLAGTLATTNGGTGLTSFTANRIFYASSTSVIAQSAGLTFDGTNFATTGRASATAFTVTANTNPVNGMNLYGANNLGLYTNSAVSVFISATQQIGILNQTPQRAFDVGPATVSGLATHGGLIRITGYNTDGNAAQGLEFQGRGDAAGFGNRISHRSNNGDLVFEGRANSASWTEIARMFPTGGVSIGNTTDPGAGKLIVSNGALVGNTVSAQGSALEATSNSLAPAMLARVNANADESQWAFQAQKKTATNTTSQIFVRFLINDGATPSGYITANGANQATFTSSSDARLKENIVSLPNQLANILALEPVEFDYIDGSGTQIGFIAQKMQEIYPDAVSEGPDGMLQIGGWSKTEARLVKAIQEQQAIIEQLKAKVGL